MASEIVTKDELGQYLGRKVLPGNADDKARLGAHAWLENICGRIFAPVDDYVEPKTVEDYGQSKLLVDNPPIRAINSITSGRTSPSIVSPDSYVIENAKAGIIRMVSMYLTPGVHAYTVNYKGGFTTYPEDLRLLVCSLVGRAAEKQSKHRHGMRGRSFAQGSFEYYEKDLEPEERRILNIYRRTLYYA